MTHNLQQWKHDKILSRIYDDLEQGAQDIYKRLDKEIQSNNISESEANDLRQHVKDLTDVDDIRLIHDIIDRKIGLTQAKHIERGLQKW